MKDLQGRPYLKADEISDGVLVEVDGDFPCMKGTQQVKHLERYGYYLDCDDGTHFLDGQLSDDGTHYVGIYLAEGSPE